MQNKFGKIKSYVRSLDLNEIEKEGQVLLLAGDNTYGAGTNGSCENYNNCTSASNRSGCSNYTAC